MLKDVYVDITGQKEISRRPEMLRLLRECLGGEVDCIAAQTKGYLAANTKEFCYLIRLLFDSNHRIDIITEDNMYHIDKPPTNPYCSGRADESLLSFFCFLGKLWSDWNTLGYARLRTPLLLVVTRKAKTTICCGCVEKWQQYVVKSEDRCGPQIFDRDKIARQKEKNSNQGASAPKMLKFLLVLQR